MQHPPCSFRSAASMSAAVCAASSAVRCLSVITTTGALATSRLPLDSLLAVGSLGQQCPYFGVATGKGQTANKWKEQKSSETRFEVAFKWVMKSNL